MKKNIFILIILFITLGLLSYYYLPREKVAGDSKQTKISDISLFKNSSFEIEGTNITLKDGRAEEEIYAGESSRVVTTYFGNESVGDMNSDSIPDSAFMVTQENGGSGVFYYAVIGIKTEDGYDFTNAFFIGDRIAPQNTAITDQKLHVFYAEREAGEPFTARPSVGVDKILVLDSLRRLVEFLK